MSLWISATVQVHVRDRSMNTSHFSSPSFKVYLLTKNLSTLTAVAAFARPFWGIVLTAHSSSGCSASAGTCSDSESTLYSSLDTKTARQRSCLCLLQDKRDELLTEAHKIVVNFPKKLLSNLSVDVSHISVTSPSDKVWCVLPTAGLVTETPVVWESQKTLLIISLAKSAPVSVPVETCCVNLLTSYLSANLDRFYHICFEGGTTFQWEINETGKLKESEC